jgi:hypothetical protein
MAAIRRSAALALALAACGFLPACALAQKALPAPPSPSATPWVTLAAATPRPPTPAALGLLPDAPSAIHPPMTPEIATAVAAPCRAHASFSGGPGPDTADSSREPCVAPPDPYARFLDSPTPIPLTPAQKAQLALRNLSDPGNLATVAYLSGFIIATDSHTAYGPGWKGFGRNAGYSLLQDATGEFFGTFLIPSIAGQDPHYHRLPHANVPRRILHAISRTFFAQSDYGASMPNFSALLTYPIVAEISNLYVPGIRDNGPSTVARILTGYATDPAENLITEFLPDFARRIHVRIIFVQRVLNPVSTEDYSLP